MTAHERPRDMLWIEVPATSSAEDLARVVDAYPPGTEGRSYLVHMDLLAGRVAFGGSVSKVEMAMFTLPVRRHSG
jgi:hypothetical protein